MNTYSDGRINFRDCLMDLLAYHKDEKPLSSLLEIFQQGNEVTASYICCLIAKYSVIYSRAYGYNKK